MTKVYLVCNGGNKERNIHNINGCRATRKSTSKRRCMDNNKPLNEELTDKIFNHLYGMDYDYFVYQSLICIDFNKNLPYVYSK